MTTFRDARSGAAITVAVTARAQKTALAGVLENGVFKVRVAAPAVDGRANAALTAFLAKALGIPASQVEIVAGHTGSRKLISLVGVTPQEVEARLLPAGRPRGRQAKGR